MTDQEIDQRHLEYATGDAAIWFRNVPRISRVYVMQRWIDSITARFRNEERHLFHFEVREIDPRTFQAVVNHHAIVKMELAKEVSDGDELASKNY
jgi:hypothetical protein